MKYTLPGVKKRPEIRKLPEKFADLLTEKLQKLSAKEEIFCLREL